jgi:hypothetical protein
VGFSHKITNTQFLISIVVQYPSENFWVTETSPLRAFGICFMGDSSSSLYTDTSRTETGLGCSGATVASSANDPSSSNLEVDF